MSILLLTALSSTLNITLLLLVVLAVYMFVRSPVFENYDTKYQILEDGIFVIIHFLGFMTTLVEVLGLALQEYLTGDQDLFNAITRFLIAGVFEALFTFFFTSQVIKSLRRSSEDRVITFWEKIKAIGLNLPLFFIASFWTHVISIMYFDTIGSLKMSVTGEMWPPWNIFDVNSVSSSVSGVSPEISAFVLIYATPVLSVTLALIILIRPSDEILAMVDAEENISASNRRRSQQTSNSNNTNSRGNNSSSQTNRNRSRSSSGSTEGSSSSTTNNDDDDDENDQGQQNNRTVIIDDQELDKCLYALGKVWNVSDSIKNSNFLPNELNEEKIKDIRDYILKYCGINPDLSGAKVYEDITALEVSKFIVNLTANGTDNVGKSPSDFYKAKIMPIIYKDPGLDRSGVLNGYSGYKKLISEMTLDRTEFNDAYDALQIAKSQLEQASTLEEKDRLRSELQQAKLRYQLAESKVNQGIEQFLKTKMDEVNTIAQIFKKGIQGIGYEF